MDGDYLGNQPGWLRYGKQDFELDYEKAIRDSRVTRQTDYPSVLQEMVDKLGPDFERQMEKISCNSERVMLCYHNEYLSKIFAMVIESSADKFKHRKNANKSTQYRTDGNESFCQDRFEEAVYNYTFAIVYAPSGNCSKESRGVEVPNPDCAELALAYGNRSAAFYHLRKYQSCLSDIESALTYGYERYKPVRKLLVRKVETLIALRHFAEAKKMLDQIDTVEDDDRCQAMRIELIGMLDEVYQPEPLDLKKPSFDYVANFYRNCPQFKPSTTSRPSLSHKVEIGYSEERGRHIRCGSEPIQPGELLIAELPYSSVLLEPYEQKNCHHCCRTMEPHLEALVACSKCTKVLYCSVQCQEESWSLYHQFECNFLDVLYSIGVGHLAFRLLLVAGLDTVCHSEIALDADSLDEDSPNPHFAEFSKIFNLVHHSGKFPTADLVQYSITCSLLLQLAVRSGFLGPKPNDSNLRQVAGMLLRFMLQLVSNAHSVSHLMADDMFLYGFDLDDDANCSKFEDRPVASALYPTLSLLNHSCDPNMTTLFEPSDGTFAKVVATRRIEPGQEVTTCYRVHWARYDYLRRKSMLASQYFFECQCEACVRERSSHQLYLSLGLSPLLVSYNNEISSCPQCRAWASLSLQSNLIVCSQCGATVNRDDLQQRIGRISRNLYRMRNLSMQIDARIESESPSRIGDIERKVVSSVSSHLSKLESELQKLCAELLCPDRCLPFGKLCDQLSYFHYASRIQLDKATQFCQRNVDTVRRCFGSHSMELAQEMIKLADLHWIRLDAHFENHMITEPSTRQMMQECDVVTELAIQRISPFVLDQQDMSSFLAKQVKRFKGRLRELRTDFASSSEDENDDVQHKKQTGAAASLGSVCKPK